MPNLQNPSLINTTDQKYETYKYWLDLANDHRECWLLIRDLKGIPLAWLEWVEKETKARIKRGVYIEKPLKYRMKTLWNGIILLQEAKFICDVVETSFRQFFFIHTINNMVKYHDIFNTIPEINSVKRQFEKNHTDIETEDYVSWEFVSLFTFYQLTETIYRNWSKIDGDSIKKPGFTQSINNKRCKNADTFKKDMKTIRNYRNSIAHSKLLFTPEDVITLYKLSSLWLSSLDVKLETKIYTYRQERPRFLELLSVNKL